MLRAVEFKDKRFMVKDNNNLFSPITKNAIILCHNYKLMDSLSKEIIDTVNGLAEYNDYDCDDEDVGSAKLILSFGEGENMEFRRAEIAMLRLALDF